MSNTSKDSKPFKGKTKKARSTTKCSKKQSLAEKLTTVNTTYARIVLLLLTINFAFTGYAVYSITQIQDAAMSSNAGSTSGGAQVASTEQ
jgi:hypothetical protein